MAEQYIDDASTTVSATNPIANATRPVTFDIVHVTDLAGASIAVPTRIRVENELLKVTAINVGTNGGTTDTLTASHDGGAAASAHAAGASVDFVLTHNGLTTGLIDYFIPNTLITTTGDLIYASGANTPARLPIGSTNQVLTVVGGVPSWQTPAGASSIASEFYTTTNTSIPNNALTKIPMTLTRFDPTGLYDAANTRIKIATAGTYWVYGKLRHSTSTAIFAYLFVNGVQRAEGLASQNFTGGGIGIVGSLLQLSVNDYVEIYGYQASGGATAIDGSNSGYNYLDITKVA